MTFFSEKKTPKNSLLFIADLLLEKGKIQKKKKWMGIDLLLFLHIPTEWNKEVDALARAGVSRDILGVSNALPKQKI